MRRIVLLFVSITLALNGFSQEWAKKLHEKKEKGEKLNLYEISKEFESYWEPYNVKGGYFLEDGMKKKAGGWKQFKRWEWYWSSRVNPITGEFPETNTPNEMEQFKMRDSKSSNSGNWIQAGPKSSLGGYSGIGRINTVEFHPTDDNTYWAGTPGGGLWVTTDNGSNWTVLTDNNTALGVSAIAVRSDYATSKTIYIGTGDRDGGSAWSLGGGNVNDNNSIGLLKSTDGGVTWQNTGLSYVTSEKKLIGDILLYPEYNDTIFVSTSDGIQRSYDGGATWTKVKSTDRFVVDMEFKPGDPNTIYAATTDDWTGEPYILKTIDGGDTWTTIKTFNSADRRVELAVSENDPNYLYALVSYSDGGFSAVYRSIDAGATFTKTFDKDDANLFGWYSDGSDSGGQGTYDICLAASPADKNVLFVGGVNTWKSTDGGTTWEINNMWTSYSAYNKVGANVVHADKHDIVFRDGNTVFEVNDGGIYLSSDIGATWHDKTNDMIISQMYRIGVSQVTDGTVVTGLQDNGSKMIDGGVWSDVTGGDGMECLIDYSDDDIQYATYANGTIYRTDDRWADYSTIRDGGGYWVTPYIIDPVNPKVLYVGNEEVYKTSDRGNSFNKISSVSAGSLRSMAICESNNKVLWVANQTKIWKTEDGGSNWHDISSNLPSSSNALTYLAIHNENPDTAWITYGGYNSARIYETLDGGDTWTNISTGLPNIPVFSVVQNKLAPEQQLYVGTDQGVYIKNGTSSWERFSNNLPNVMVAELEIYYDKSNPANSKLYAGTFGRGLWYSTLDMVGKDLSVDKIDGVESQYCSAKTIVPEIIIKNNGLNTITSATIKLKLNSEPYKEKMWTGNIDMLETDTIVLDTLALSSGNHTLEALIDVPNGSVDENTTNDTLKLEFYYFNESNLPYTQNFEKEEIPGCFNNIDNNSNNVEWLFNNPSNVVFNSTTNADGFAIIDAGHYSAGDAVDADLISPVFDFTAFSGISLNFEHYFVAASGSSAKMMYSTDAGESWNTLQTISATTANAETFTQDITTEVAGKDSIQFKWNFIGSTNDNNYWAIDDVSITGTTTGQSIVTTKAVTDLGYTTATLNGLVNANGNSLADIMFEVGTVTGVYTQTIEAGPNESSSSFNVGVFANIEGLEEDTKYFFRLKANDGTDVIGEEMSFTTLKHDLFVGSVDAGPYLVSAVISADVSVPYTIEGEYYTGNKFKAYLSDASGSFANEIVIGTKAVTSASTITASIPGNTPSGTGYKVRVKSDQPVIVSDESTAFEIVLDDVAPSVVITSTLSDTTTEKSIPVTITFDEAVAGFTANDIDVTNGNASAFASTSSTVYTTTVTPLSVGDVTIEIDANSAFDQIGNGNTAGTWEIYYRLSTGINDLSDLGLTIYPNPSKGKIIVKSENQTGQFSVQILDISGRLVYSDQFRNTNEFSVDLSEEPSGVYFIKLNKDGEVVNAKLIIE